jgi:TolB-like protein/class 3 adenylate cyclase
MPSSSRLDPGGTSRGRKLVAVMYADVVGYSNLLGLDDVGTLERLRALRTEVIDSNIAEHGGLVVQTGGDSLLIVFDSIEGAVRCAVTVQQQVPNHDKADASERRIRFRMGIDIGDAIAEGTDLHGDGVIVAARLQAECPAGAVCVSRAVRDHVHDRLELAFEALGPLSLKNVARPVEAFLVGPSAIPKAAPAEAYELRPDVTAAASTDLRARNREALPLPEKPSIAVLPFTNLSGDPEEDYFADGLVEDIIWALSRVQWLFVIARNSSFTYKGRSVDVRQVGRELGVRYVLEGSVRRAEQRVRVAAQLIDALNGVHVWADRFDAASQDIFELQDLVAGSVAGQIEPQVRLTEIERASCRSVHNLDAYDLLLRAIGQIHMHTAASINEAVVLLRRALAIEPEYALAAALIADCRVIMQAQCWHTLSDAEVSETIDFARQAVHWGMDDPDALCWASLGLSIFANDRVTASNLIDRALRLNTNSAHAWSARAWLYCHQGQARAAIDAFERALRLSPLDPMGGYSKGGLALANLALGNYKAASDWASQSLSELPRYVSAMRTNVAAYAHLCRPDEARYWLAQLLELQPAMTIRTWRTSSGYPPEVLSILEEGLRIAGLPEG